MPRQYTRRPWKTRKGHLFSQTEREAELKPEELKYPVPAQETILALRRENEDLLLQLKTLEKRLPP